MPQTLMHSRAHSMLLGSLVGDAASMGFHWLYDQEQIKTVAGDNVTFRSPNRSDYQDKGYFAHEGKRAGQPSQYGAQLLSMVDSIARKGRFELPDYVQSFREWFDYGGKWVGYIDHPTKTTLQNIAKAEEFEQPITACGADDQQLPALSKLPALIARHYADEQLNVMVESAVRVTNNNQFVVDCALVVTDILCSVLQGVSPADAVTKARAIADGKVLEKMDEAISLSQLSSEKVAQQLGMHCDLDAAFGVIIHILSTSKNYQQAITTNILCGGDNCGRSIILGAVFGACSETGSNSGIPAEWIAKLELPATLYCCAG